MIKCLLTLVMFSLSVSIFAQTQIFISPVRPINCQMTDAPHVNWIYKLTKISDTVDEAVFEFTTQHGYCANKKVVPYVVDERYANVGLFRDGVVLPWQKEGAEATFTMESESELRVRMVFDKKDLFKKKTSRTLAMYFEPGLNYGPIQLIRQPNGGLTTWQAKLTFPWTIFLIVDQVTKVSQLSIQ